VTLTHDADDTKTNASFRRERSTSGWSKEISGQIQIIKVKNHNLMSEKL
jgi:hypothetical protein